MQLLELPLQSKTLNTTWIGVGLVQEVEASAQVKSIYGLKKVVSSVIRRTSKRPMQQLSALPSSKVVAKTREYVSEVKETTVLVLQIATGGVKSRTMTTLERVLKLPHKSVAL